MLIIIKYLSWMDLIKTLIAIINLNDRIYIYESKIIIVNFKKKKKKFFFIIHSLIINNYYFFFIINNHQILFINIFIYSFNYLFITIFFLILLNYFLF